MTKQAGLHRINREDDFRDVHEVKGAIWRKGMHMFKVWELCRSVYCTVVQPLNKCEVGVARCYIVGLQPPTFTGTCLPLKLL